MGRCFDGVAIQAMSATAGEFSWSVGRRLDGITVRFYSGKTRCSCLRAISGPDPGDVSSMVSRLDFDARRGIESRLHRSVDERETRYRRRSGGDGDDEKAEDGTERSDASRLAVQLTDQCRKIFFVTRKSKKFCSARCQALIKVHRFRQPDVKRKKGKLARKKIKRTGGK